MLPEPVLELKVQEAEKLYLVVPLVLYLPPLFEQLVERQLRPAVRAAEADVNPDPEPVRLL